MGTRLYLALEVQNRKMMLDLFELVMMHCFFGGWWKEKMII